MKGRRELFPGSFVFSCQPLVSCCTESCKKEKPLYIPGMVPPHNGLGDLTVRTLETARHWKLLSSACPGTVSEKCATC